MEKVNRYVVGLLFSVNSVGEPTKVALIRKTKPDWQSGKLNGLGGKIEKDEKPLDAMRREFQEESGVFVSSWHGFMELKGIDTDGKQFVVYFFNTFISYNAGLNLQTTTEEEVGWYELCELHNHHDTITVSNLKWIIPLALDKNGSDKRYVLAFD